MFTMMNQVKNKYIKTQLDCPYVVRFKDIMPPFLHMDKLVQEKLIQWKVSDII